MWSCCGTQAICHAFAPRQEADNLHGARGGRCHHKGRGFTAQHWSATVPKTFASMPALLLTEEHERAPQFTDRAFSSRQVQMSHLQTLCECSSKTM